MSLLRQEERGNLSEPIDLLLVTIAMSSVIACLRKQLPPNILHCNLCCVSYGRNEIRKPDDK